MLEKIKKLFKENSKEKEIKRMEEKTSDTQITIKKRDLILRIYFKNKQTYTVTTTITEDCDDNIYTTYKEFLKWYYGRPKSNSYLFYTWSDKTTTEVKRNDIDHIQMQEI